MTDYTPTEMKKMLDAAKREGRRDMIEKVRFGYLPTMSVPEFENFLDQLAKGIGDANRS